MIAEEFSKYLKKQTKDFVDNSLKFRANEAIDIVVICNFLANIINATTEENKKSLDDADYILNHINATVKSLLILWWEDVEEPEYGNAEEANPTIN